MATGPNNQSQRNETQKTTLYPPPSAQLIEKIVYSMRLDRYIVLLSNSSLCVYKRVKETALLERIQESSEVKDSEFKRAMSQAITCMELVTTSYSGTGRKEIASMDTEILNHKLHVLTLVAAVADPATSQECLALGLSKGAVIFLHVCQLDRVFCRFTIHRAAVLNIKYLPNSKVFISVCAEFNFKIWKLDNKEKKAFTITTFKIPKPVEKFHLIPLPEYKGEQKDRFLIVFKTGESEMFEWDQKQEVLFHIESDKSKDHDCPLTGCDYMPQPGLLVTSDTNGTIRIWNKDKKFLREIQFPNSIDSVSFLNQSCDLLVSHDQRISNIKFETYWTKIFDYYGITSIQTREFDAPDENSVYSDQDFVLDEDQPRKIRIETDFAFQVTINPQFGQNPHLKNQAAELLTKIMGNLGGDDNVTSGQLDPSQLLSSNENSYRKNVTSNRNLQTMADKQKAAAKDTKPAKVTKEDTQIVITRPTEDKKDEKPKEEGAPEEQLSTNRPPQLTAEELEAIRQAKLREIYKPAGVSIPKETGLSKVGLMQPLPGVSYLATSPTYYEMMSKAKSKRRGNPMNTRRQITENRITSNIMSFNQPVAFVDTSNMEVSMEYYTQVNQSKFQISTDIFTRNALPLDYLLNVDFNSFRNNPQMMGAAAGMMGVAMSGPQTSTSAGFGQQNLQQDNFMVGPDMFQQQQPSALLQKGSASTGSGIKSQRKSSNKLYGSKFGQTGGFDSNPSAAMQNYTHGQQQIGQRKRTVIPRASFHAQMSNEELMPETRSGIVSRGPMPMQMHTTQGGVSSLLGQGMAGQQQIPTQGSNLGGDTEANWNKAEDRMQSMNIDEATANAGGNQPLRMAQTLRAGEASKAHERTQKLIEGTGATRKKSNVQPIVPILGDIVQISEQPHHGTVTATNARMQPFGANTTKDHFSDTMTGTTGKNFLSGPGSPQKHTPSNMQPGGQILQPNLGYSLIGVSKTQNRQQGPFAQPVGRNFIQGEMKTHQPVISSQGTAISGQTKGLAGVGVISNKGNTADSRKPNLQITGNSFF